MRYSAVMLFAVLAVTASVGHASNTTAPDRSHVGTVQLEPGSGGGAAVIYDPNRDGARKVRGQQQRCQEGDEACDESG